MNELNVSIFHFAGEIVNLSLDKTTDANFRGFIIQARDAEENPIGSFQFEDDSVSQMTCGEGIHNSITHRNPDEKTGMRPGCTFCFLQVSLAAHFALCRSTWWMGGLVDGMLGG